MSYAAPWLFYDAGAPLATTIFATDAMGHSEVDAGGYGITVRDVSRAAIEQILEYGESQGRSVSRLSGDFTGLKFPERPIKASEPFSLLPNEIFQDEEKARWLPMAWGRWKTVDHITLGEARAVVRLARLLSVRPSARRHFVIIDHSEVRPNLQNQPEGNNQGPIVLPNQRPFLCNLHSHTTKRALHPADIPMEKAFAQDA